ncbi:MAG: hypothetical protein KatS3mg061_3204 [Dehalococcoidia bacterium]|nr:MAG: hypothetical protein KatS3mg061_3204 [Dehalococcoidia bacterium]
MAAALAGSPGAGKGLPHSRGQLRACCLLLQRARGGIRQVSLTLPLTGDPGMEAVLLRLATQLAAEYSLHCWAHRHANALTIWLAYPTPTSLSDRRTS